MTRKIFRTTLALGALIAAAFTLSACHVHGYGSGYYGQGQKGGYGNRGGHKRDGHYRRGGGRHRRGY